MGWRPFHSHDEFDQYRAENPDLEPFSPTDYGFETSEYAAEAKTSDRAGVSQEP